MEYILYILGQYRALYIYESRISSNCIFLGGTRLPCPAPPKVSLATTAALLPAVSNFFRIIFINIRDVPAPAPTPAPAPAPAPCDPSAAPVIASSATANLRQHLLCPTRRVG
eukprot:8998056-Pyramimonas_sp.AAC.1